MFRHPFDVKSNNQMKISDRKQLKERFIKEFHIPEELLADVFAKKSSIHNVKIVTEDGQSMNIYVADKVPLAFLWDTVLYPTVFLLWKHPSLYHSFTIHENVTKFIKSGADLMLPGVCFPPGPSSATGNKYGNVRRGEIVYVNLTDNRAAFAVGVAAQSSAEMLARGGRGKCVLILHFYGDKLSKFEGLSMICPKLGPPSYELESDIRELQDQAQSVLNITEDTPFKEHNNTAEEAASAVKNEELDKATSVESKRPEELEGATSVNTDKAQKLSAKDIVLDMDSTLEVCCLIALKYSKTLKLPILTSTFYKVELLPLIPPEKNFDIKKTSYKKLKPFLDFMQQLGFLAVKETSKGVESIVSINHEHQKLKTFYADPDFRPKSVRAVEGQSNVTCVEKFMITPQVSAIFLEKGYRKGDSLLPEDVRKHVTAYVKNNRLQDPENPQLIQPNTALSKICKTEEKLTWEQIMTEVLSHMKKSLEVKSGHEEIVTKGEAPKIAINVATRSGNKKVTLIDNLELYGVNLAEFSKECMHGVAASTSISKPPGKKYDQLMVQGNQVTFVYNLLTERYKIPKKFIAGLPAAPKKKKK